MKFSESTASRLLFLVTSMVLLTMTASFLWNLRFPDSRINFLGKSKRVELTAGAPVTQIFTADREGLTAVKLVMGDVDLSLGESIVFELTDEACSAVIRSSKFGPLSPEPLIYHSFVFDRIPDSSGKTYCIRVTYSSDTMRKNRPYLSASEGERYAEMSYTDTGKGRIYENRTLQMRPAYTNETFTGNVRELENRLSQYKPGFIKGYVLLLGGLALIGMIALARTLFLRPPED